MPPTATPRMVEMTIAPLICDDEESCVSQAGVGVGVGAVMVGSPWFCVVVSWHACKSCRLLALVGSRRSSRGNV